MNRIFRLIIFTLICALLFAVPAQATVANKPVALKSFKLNYASKAVAKGYYLQLTVAQLKPADAAFDPAKLKWSSSAPKVATVSKTGLVTAHARGTATIKAKYGQKTATCTIKVKIPLRSITLNKKGIYTIVGKTHTVKVKSYAPKNTTSKKNAKWTSSDKSIATVNSKGQIKTKGAGTAVITCTVDNATASCEVVVYKKSEYYRAELLRLVNIERANHGLSPVQMNDALLQAAAVRSNEIIKYFSHTRPDGRSCFTVIDHGPSGSLGENIAKTSGVTLNAPTSVMRMWMNSPDHRRNILNPDFAHFGAGVINKGNRFYWVQIFSKMNY